MLKVSVPNNFHNDRKYVVNVIFYEFLGVNYRIECIDNLKKCLFKW